MNDNAQPYKKQPIDPWRWYTLRQSARLADLSAKEINRAIRSDDLRCREFKLRRRVRGDAIINFLERRGGLDGGAR